MTPWLDVGRHALGLRDQPLRLATIALTALIFKPLCEAYFTGASSYFNHSKNQKFVFINLQAAAEMQLMTHPEFKVQTVTFHADHEDKRSEGEIIFF